MSIDEVIRSIDEQIGKLQQAKAFLNSTAPEKQRAGDVGHEQ